MPTSTYTPEILTLPARAKRKELAAERLDEKAQAMREEAASMRRRFAEAVRP